VKKELKKIALYHSAIICPGGAERLLLQEYLFFKRMGIEIKILTHMITKEALFNYNIPDLEILGGGNPFCRTILLRKRLREINPDLVISASGSLELFLATVFTSLPYILHIHGSLFWFDEDLLKYAMIHRGIFNEIRESVIGHKEFIPLKPKCNLVNRIKLEFAAILDYLAVKKAKKIFVLSPHMKWEVAKIYGKDAIVLRGAIRSSLPNYKPRQDIKKRLGLGGRKIILSVSRLDRRKRIGVLIKAFAKLTTDFDNIILVIVGIGPEMRKLKYLTKKLGLQDKVIFTGYVNDNELWDYYAACDLFATPAWADFDLTPYEAMAMQKRVVWSSEMAGDLLKDERVVSANPTVEDFAKGIKKAITMKINKKIDIQEYTWENYFTKLLNIYREIVHEKRKS